jgi:hypothetical protein
MKAGPGGDLHDATDRRGTDSWHGLGNPLEANGSGRRPRRWHGLSKE